MPRLNQRGEWCAGVGGVSASAKGMELARPAGGTAWVDDDRVVFGRRDPMNPRETWETAEFDLVQKTLRVVSAEAPSFNMEGGGGVWAGGVGGENPRVYTSTGLIYPGAGLLAVGPEGSLVITPDYFSGRGMRIHRPGGSIVELPDLTGRAVHMPTSSSLVFTRGDKVQTWGIALPAVASGSLYTPRAVISPSGAWWLVYILTEPRLERLIVQPWDEAVGYVLVESTTSLRAYRPDAVFLSKTLLRVVYATNEGESIGSVVVRDLDITTARVALRTGIPAPAPPPPPPPPPPPEKTMQLPTNVLFLVRRFAGTFPPPQGEPGTAHEDLCRRWSIKLAEQVANDFGTTWGVKKAGPTRPISKDSLALQENGLHSWDILVGAGTGRPILATSPAYYDIGSSGQVFVPVTATNWLMSRPIDPPPPAPPPPLPPPPPPPPVAGVATYDTSLQLETVVGRIRARYREVHGHDAGWSDLGHNLWRWYREGRWTSLEDILADIGK